MTPKAVHQRRCFVNAIAEAIEKDHRTFASTRSLPIHKPPKTLRPRPNVIVTCARSSAALRIRWKPAVLAKHPPGCIKLRSQSLHCSTSGLHADFCITSSRFELRFSSGQCQFFSRHGVKAFRARQLLRRRRGEMGPLGHVLAKLLWNPDTDVRRISPSSSPYGRAKDPGTDVRIAREKASMRIFDPTSVPYLAAEILRKSES